MDRFEAIPKNTYQAELTDVHVWCACDVDEAASFLSRMHSGILRTFKCQPVSVCICQNT